MEITARFFFRKHSKAEDLSTYPPLIRWDLNCDKVVFDASATASKSSILFGSTPKPFRHVDRFLPIQPFWQMNEQLHSSNNHFVLLPWCHGAMVRSSFGAKELANHGNNAPFQW